MRKKKNVLDFRDFRDCINARGIALEMLPEDFYDFKSKLCKGKDTCYPHLDGVVVTKFEKGKVWQNFEVFQRKPCPRGIPLLKKDDIVKKLCPLMEEPNRRVFWEALPVADVPALIAEH